MKILALSLLGLAASLAPARATLVYNQNFEGLAGSGSGTALNGQGSYTADATVKVYNGGGVTYADNANGLAVDGGGNAVNLNVAAGASNANLALVSFTPASSADLFFSFTFNYTNANKAADTGADFFRLQFQNTTNTNSTDFLAIQIQGSQASTNSLFLTRGRSATNNPGVNTAGGVAFTDNGTVTYLVSGKLTWNAANGNYDTVTMWINPTSTNSAPTSGQYLGTQTSSMAGSTLSSISALMFQNGATSDNLETGDSMKIDNLRLGTAWSDVAAVSAVPEPSACAVLAGAAALGLAACRRRRAA